MPHVKYDKDTWKALPTALLIAMPFVRWIIYCELTK